MSKTYYKKILSLLLAAFVALGTLAAGAVQVNAADEDWQMYVQTPAWTGTEWYIDVFDNNSTDWGTINSATSSDTSIFKVVKHTYGEDTYYYVKGKKAGKAKLTVNYTKPSGETATITKTVKVKKYPYEIKSLKVNGKKVKISKNKYYYRKKVSKSKAKVNIKMALKKGWKITNVYADRSKDGKNYKPFTVKKAALKKGSAIKFPKKYKYCWINVTLKKGNEYIQYTFDFYR